MDLACRHDAGDCLYGCCRLLCCQQWQSAHYTGCFSVSCSSMFSAVVPRTAAGGYFPGSCRYKKMGVGVTTAQLELCWEAGGAHSEGVGPCAHRIWKNSFLSHFRRHGSVSECPCLPPVFAYIATSSKFSCPERRCRSPSLRYVTPRRFILFRSHAQVAFLKGP